jgi:predicted amidophosphoribosyltransferase
MRTLVADLADLILPRTCVACGSAGVLLCDRCVRPGLWWADADPPVTASGPYDGALRTALLAYKERDRRDLARVLGRHLAGAAALHQPATFVPVPSSAAARRARGGDHVARLARFAARECHTSTARPLRLVRVVGDSAGLDAAARAANLRGAMVARPCAGRRAVLLDDIATTGTTLREATRALRHADWQVVGAAVVAATLRRTPAAASGGSLRPGLAWENLNE